MSDLYRRAAAAGLAIDWQDADGCAQRVEDAALAAILDRLEAPTDAADFLSADVGEALHLSSTIDGPGELVLEDGTRHAVRIERGRGSAIDTIGYHRLEVGDRSFALAIAPARCFSIADAVQDRRIWTPAVQIPALRRDAPSAFGDFGALAEAAREAAVRGADALAISPVHALFPADATRFSPYAPSTRDFLNVVLADPGVIGVPLPGEPGPELIDWAAAIPARLAALRAVHEGHAHRFAAELADFRKAGGEALARHALFDALHAHFHARDRARGWQQWPAAFHDPAGTATARFAAEHAVDVDFHLFLQWLARRGLDAAQAAAREAGMAIGLVADLAVGIDPGGSHGWNRRGDLLQGLSIGAPPDPLGPDGQNWGITGFDPPALRRSGFAPFAATIRAALAHAGGIRIDHAFGLRRLWVMPEGASAAEGAYLAMPFNDMMRILAIESYRARAIVVGEDLGTVPDGFRAAMDARAMLGMRVLWFERDADGFVPPARWSRQAAAMTGTHDLPTVAGWWRGRDIDWTWTLGRRSSAPDEAADRAARAEDRTALWTALDTGTPQPADEVPAAVVDAALAHVAGTPSALAILPIEDLAGLVEQLNLPGTIEEHPNWRRRLPAATGTLLADPRVTARIDAINAARTA